MLARIETVFVRLIDLIARSAAWLIVLLMLVIVFDVVARRLRLPGGTMYQELEWHLHTIIFCSALGYAYLHNVHVRVDSFMNRLSERARAWVEIIGFFVFLLPFAFVILWYGVDFAFQAYLVGEKSDSPGGLTHRWLIKSVLPIGMALLILAGLVVLRRCIQIVLGRRDVSPFA